MITEIIEAIHLMYEDNSDLETQCMLFLKDLILKSNSVNSTGPLVEWFNEHERCITCGTLFKNKIYYESHTELDENPREKLYEPYCPVCDC